MGKWHVNEVVKASKTLISHALSRQSLSNSLHDLSETVAHAQQRTDLEAAFQESRQNDTDRYQPNFWLSAYQTLQGDFKGAVQRCQDIANVFVALNDGAEALVAQVNNAPLTHQIQAHFKQAGQELSQHPFRHYVQKAVQEEIGDDLRYWGYALQSQKELFLDTVRGLVDSQPLPPVAYFLDDMAEVEDGFSWAENRSEERHHPETMEPQQSAIQQARKIGQYAWQRARQDSRFLAERFGYLVLDALEMEAQQNNPQLAQALAEVRQQGTHRVATNKLSKIAEAASVLVTTIQEQSRQIHQIMADSYEPATR